MTATLPAGLTLVYEDYGMGVMATQAFSADARLGIFESVPKPLESVVRETLDAATGAKTVSGAEFAWRPTSTSSIVYDARAPPSSDKDAAPAPLNWAGYIGSASERGLPPNVYFYLDTNEVAVHAARPLAVNEILLCDRFDDFTPKVLAAMAEYTRYVALDVDRRRAIPDWLAVRETPPYGLGVVVRKNHTTRFVDRSHYEPLGWYTGPVLSKGSADLQPDNEYLLTTIDAAAATKIIIDGRSIEQGASWPRWINRCNEPSEENVVYERGGVVYPKKSRYTVGEELRVKYGGNFVPSATLEFRTLLWSNDDAAAAEVVGQSDLDKVFEPRHEKFWRDTDEYNRFANRLFIRRRLVPFLELVARTVGTALAKGIFLTMVNVSALVDAADGNWQRALPLVRVGNTVGDRETPIVVTISQAAPNAARSLLLCLTIPVFDEKARADYEFAAIRDLFTIQHERDGNQLIVEVDTTRFPHHYFGLAQYNESTLRRFNPFGGGDGRRRYMALLQRTVRPHWSSAVPRLYAEFAAVLDDYAAVPKHVFEYRATMPTRTGESLVDEVQAIGFVMNSVAFVRVYTELTGGEARDETLYVSLVRDSGAEYVGVVPSTHAKWLRKHGYSAVPRGDTGFIRTLAMNYASRITFLKRRRPVQ